MKGYKRAGMNPKSKHHDQSITKNKLSKGYGLLSLEVLKTKYKRSCNLWKVVGHRKLLTRVGQIEDGLLYQQLLWTCFPMSLALCKNKGDLSTSRVCFTSGIMRTLRIRCVRSPKREQGSLPSGPLDPKKLVTLWSTPAHRAKNLQVFSPTGPFTDKSFYFCRQASDKTCHL